MTDESLTNKPAINEPGSHPPVEGAVPELYRAATEDGTMHHERGGKPGLSFTPGLRPVPGSMVPGTDVPHVFGPQQSPVDPIAAGLDTKFAPVTRAENRVVTLTGETASGPHPGEVHAAEDGTIVKPPPDEDSRTLPGPAASPDYRPV